MLENEYYKKDLNDIASLSIFQYFEGRSFLITGATGLICSFIIDVLMYHNRLYNSHIKVYAISRNEQIAKQRFGAYWKEPNFKFVKQDISEPISINEPFDFIIHGASNASPQAYASDPVGTMKANIWGMANLLDFSINMKSRILYISSSEVYGEGDGADFTETYSGYVNCLNPRSCYPSSKRAAESLCASYVEQYKQDVVIARPCHIYGPTMTSSDNRVIAQFMRNVLQNENIILKSAGTQIRSYCYVADCASAIFHILRNGITGEAYNIANSSSTVSIYEIAHIIASIGNKEVVQMNASLNESKGYSVVTRSVLDATKLEKLGWNAHYSINEGLKLTFSILK